MEVVATVSSRTEADIIASKLLSYGIKSQIVCDDEGGLHPAMAFGLGARVLVHPMNLQRAQEVLADTGDE